MAFYRYAGFSETGSSIAGEIEADSPSSARRLLQQQGIYISRLNEAGNLFNFGALRTLSFRNNLNASIN